MRFYTNEFERSHGRAPRGCGVWAFRVQGAAETVFTPCAMTYGDAKKWVARNWRSANEAFVQP